MNLEEVVSAGSDLHAGGGHEIIGDGVGEIVAEVVVEMADYAYYVTLQEMELESYASAYTPLELVGYFLLIMRVRLGQIG